MLPAPTAVEGASGDLERVLLMMLLLPLLGATLPLLVTACARKPMLPAPTAVEGASGDLNALLLLPDLAQGMSNLLPCLGTTAGGTCRVDDGAHGTTRREIEQTPTRSCGGRRHAGVGAGARRCCRRLLWRAAV